MAQGESPFQTSAAPEPTASRGLWYLLDLWFGLAVEVRRGAYVATGFGLAALKYGLEAGAIYVLTGRFFRPLDFLNPVLTMRQEFLNPPAPGWLGWAIFIWTLPFLWIAVSMSVRRAASATGSAWLGLLVLVPLVNYVVMLVLCCLPPRADVVWPSRRPTPVVDHRVRSALLGILVSVVTSLLMLLLTVYWLRDYGAVLFLATPVVVGTVSAYLYNRPYPRGLGGSLLVAQLAIGLSGAALLLFAFEGLICLVMLFPIAAVMGLLGGLVGYVIGAVTPCRAVTMVLLVGTLPLCAGAESAFRSAPEYEVVSMVEIDAPPEHVWPHVVGFSELPAPPAWYFRLGIAYPIRATIRGSGVGAVRRCEFSTGAFVEPITTWDMPKRLAFDVAEQPPPMHELSPYRHVHPPHLDGYLRCQRGEFRLVPLPGGRTRLEGSTWYEFEMHPQDYWTLWSDLCIHQIHRRVLTHIKHLSESRAAGGAKPGNGASEPPDANRTSLRSA